MTVPCLIALREEFNRLSPGRDKGADGTVADGAHSTRSDHYPDEDSAYLRGRDSDSKNEVHGLDVDSTGPWPEPFNDIMQRAIAKERARWLDPNDKCRTDYIIWNRRIYDKDADFEPAPYTGSDPHTGHAHFSARYDTQTENDTSPWGVLETVTEEQFMAWMDKWARSTKGKEALGDAVLERTFPAPEGSQDADGKWWYGSFDQQAYARIVELQKAVSDLTDLVTQTHPGGQ